jgi:ABC-type molybdate transport system ATPase subunit
VQISVLNILPGRVTSLVDEPSGAVDVSLDVGGAILYARITR